MTLVNTETGELVEVTYADVKRSVEQAKSSLEEAAEQIVWQIERQAWTVLGYSDWNEMREAEYGGAAFMVPRQDRPELVVRLRRSGLTQQDIADTAGVNIATVSRDLANARSDEPPATITNARGQERPASYRTPEPESAERTDSGMSQHGASPAPSRGAEVGSEPAPRAADSEVDLADFIDADTNVQDARYMRALLGALKAAAELHQFDAERVATIADPDVLQAISAARDNFVTWCDRVNQQRSGLRVIKGGAR